MLAQCFSRSGTYRRVPAPINVRKDTLEIAGVLLCENPAPDLAALMDTSEE
jgi:hypothetical protein